jgi:alpha-amylase
MRTTQLKRWIGRTALALAMLGLARPAMAAPEKYGVDVRDQVIYFVFTDRFCNGDRTNDFNVRRADPHAYHGGDFAGLIQHLDDIADLGATTLWFSPFNDNQDNAYMGKYWGYHGYWIQDFEKIDEHWGDEATLKRLVDEAHRRRMRVLFDAIVNHAGYDAPMVKDPARHDWFHHNGGVSDWDNPYQNENYDVAGLPDFNSENAQVLRYMTDVWAKWVDRTGADGLRLDTVRHVAIPFWNVFNGELKRRFGRDFFILGEVSYHDGRTYPPYLQRAGVDALFDFPNFEAMVEVFAKGKSPRLLAQALKLDALYPDPGMLVPFLDSHDEVRFMTQAGGDERKLRLGLAYLLTMRGIPMLYQGIEQGMEGGGDPDNRRDMQFGKNPDLEAYTRKLIALRRALKPLSRGTMKVWWVDEDTIAFARRYGGQEVVVALNNSDKPRRISVPVAADSPLKAGAVLINNMGHDAVTVVNRQITVSLAPKEAKVFTASVVNAGRPDLPLK